MKICPKPLAHRAAKSSMALGEHCCEVDPRKKGTTTREYCSARHQDQICVCSEPPVRAVGDPHMTNIFGQRFDLQMPGTHVLVRVPKDAEHDGLLLKIACEVKRMSASCADMYIQRLNLTGAWLEEKGTPMLTFSAQSGEVKKQWQKIGRIEVKVVRGATKEGVKYLNMFTKHLGKTGLRVGGLLGEDDHTTAATPMADCRQTMSL